jgi:serine/threonine protein kinase
MCRLPLLPYPQVSLVLTIVLANMCSAYGVVYRATSKLTQQVYAVKVIPLASEYDEWNKKVSSEIYILQQATHPNITKLYVLS